MERAYSSIAFTAFVVLGFAIAMVDCYGEPPMIVPPSTSEEPATTTQRQALICEVGRYDSWIDDEPHFEHSECGEHFDTCETKFEIHGERRTIVKSCVQNESCQGNRRGNPTNCFHPHQIEVNDRVCFFCCYTSECNHYNILFGPTFSEVIFRRSGTLNFDRDWDAYKEGFGEANGEYWAGLSFMHDVTSFYEHCTLTIDYHSLDREYPRTVWSEFRVGSEGENYQATADSIDGTRRDLIPTGRRRSRVVAFTTRDRDNDNNGGTNCAQRVGGGWWYYKGCHSLTGTWSRLDLEDTHATLACHQ